MPTEPCKALLDWTGYGERKRERERERDFFFNSIYDTVQYKDVVFE